MRRAFAQEAVLVMKSGADDDAPGAAITTLLCGSWDHNGPCPFAPHHTNAVRDGDRLRVRVLFAVEPDSEQSVRQRIVEALRRGCLRVPAGETHTWHLDHAQASEIAPTERQHAARLVFQG